MGTWESDAMAEIEASRAEAGNEAPPPVAGGNEPPATTIDAATASAETAQPSQPVAQPQKIRVANLDDVIIDDPRLPQSLTGQFGTALLEERKRLKHQHDQAGYERNQIAAELAWTKAALELLQKTAPDPGQPATPAAQPRQSVAEMVKTRVDPRDVLDDPTRFATSAAEAAGQYGRDEAVAEVRPEIEALRQEVQRLRQERDTDVKTSQSNAIASAYKAARPASVSEDEWFSAEQRESLAAVVLQRSLPVDDPRSYVAADDILLARARARAGVSAQPAAQPQQSAAAAPSQAGPPVGAGKPAPVQPPPARRKLDSHDKAARDKLGAIFGKDAAFMDNIEAEVMADPKYRSLF